MRVATQAIPFSDPQLRVALVQLRSPFGAVAPELRLEQNADIEPQYHWRTKELRVARCARIASILESLRGPKPHLIAFPEYTVPKECHSQFQLFADENRCVLVAGSYYDAGADSALFRNNVCKIYIPELPPVTIVKRNGFMEEAAALAVAPDEANTARLIWSTGGESYSINVYLCRDYLIPYDNGHTSQLDWDRPGLNLVIMNSAQTSLFEGQAAFDVRRLRGPGKFVALCNCAGTMIDGDGNTGTSLLGPTKSNRRLRGDVIEQLPADAESVLIADYSGPWNSDHALS
jgi:hypothetical protein